LGAEKTHHNNEEYQKKEKWEKRTPGWTKERSYSVVRKLWEERPQPRKD